MKRYEFLEHVADIYVAAYGRTLEEAFENAAAAMFDSMTDISMVTPVYGDTVRVEAEDDVALLHEWLHALLVKFEVELRLFSQFTVKEIRKDGERYFLEAEVKGEVFDREKHSSKIYVKAVTYHNMSVWRRNRCVEVRFILDI